jgi:transposase
MLGTVRGPIIITQPPAPFHPIARGRAGASLLAMILHGKFGNHLPLNRRSESFARKGIDLDVSTLADWVGACTGTLAPLVALIRSHVLGAEAWLPDVLRRISDHSASRFAELLPWDWKAGPARLAA